MSGESNAHLSSGKEGQATSSLLLKCIQEGRVDVLRSMLSQLASKPDWHELVDCVCCPDGTLLHFAVAQGSVDSVRALLSSGVNPCVQNDAARTAYQIATTNELKNAFVQEMLQATAQSKLGRVCQMLSSGVPLDSVDATKTQNSALHWAASFGNEDIVRTLCESGAMVNCVNAKGETPLHDAVRRGEEAVVRTLLMHGADAGCRDNSGTDCYQLAARLGGAMLPALSMNTLARTIRRSASLDSEMERSSIISTDMTTLFRDPTASYSSGRLQSWIDLLWPQPKWIVLDPSNRVARFPNDGRLKIYFDGASEGEPRRLMQIIQIFASFLSSVQLELEYRGHKIQEHSPLDGKVTCGVFDNGAGHGSYTLSIKVNGIELFADDYSGIRYGFATLVQILRIHRNAARVSFKFIFFCLESQNNGEGQCLESQNNGAGECLEGGFPCMTVRDFPDMSVRAVFQDFSGCKILNAETLLQLAARIGYCKASHLFVNFEVRTTDRYQLPFTNRELFHLTQVCEELFVKLVPSLDLQSNYIDSDAARRIVECFLDDFPLSKVAHFGPNLASVLVANRAILDGLQRRVTRIYLSIEVDEKTAPAVRPFWNY
ncbi:unnamed protein product [Toxocara canis]|uniref:ANK_REP_REGION domain-containing protein n=1 Tax=Toxocara canis TaxID=6265 RepID=A0A183UVD8_TOXCA|nr:unnamed protein product [Toxocara canis]